MVTNSLADQYATLTRLTGNSSVLTSEMTFWSNGQKGHCHGIKTCKRRKKGNPIAVVATPDSVTVRACSACFIFSLVEKMPAPSAVRELMGICAMVEPHIRTATTERLSVDALHNAVIGLMQAGRRLSFQKEQPGSEDAYGTIMSTIDVDIRHAMATARASMHELRSELVIPVALSLMRPNVNVIPELQPTEAERIILGDAQGSYQRNCEELFITWSAGILTNRPTDQAARRRSERPHVILLQTIGQLHGVPALPAEGLTAEQAALASWTAEKDRIVNRLLTRWNEELKALTSDESIDLVAFSENKLSGGTLASTVTEAYAVARRDSDSVVVVRVPRMISRWLAELFRNQRTLFADACHVGDARQDVIETAISLYDADVSGPYRRFTDCITAAQALLDN